MVRIIKEEETRVNIYKKVGNRNGKNNKRKSRVATKTKFL